MGMLYRSASSTSSIEQADSIKLSDDEKFEERIREQLEDGCIDDNIVARLETLPRKESLDWLGYNRMRYTAVDDQIEAKVLLPEKAKQLLAMDNPHESCIWLNKNFFVWIHVRSLESENKIKKTDLDNLKKLLGNDPEEAIKVIKRIASSAIMKDFEKQRDFLNDGLLLISKD